MATRRAQRSASHASLAAIAELAIGHKRTGLDGLYNFDEAWQLRCEAFARVSGHIAELLRLASAEGKVVAIPART